MSGRSKPTDDQTETLLNLVVDPVWYRARYRDLAASGMDPLRHFIEAGLHERRDPNRWFDNAWYARQYADVAASGAHPLLHYLSFGAKQGRDPHPRFDAGWYVGRHPDAAGNPLLFHLRIGAARGYLTERPVAIEDWSSSRKPGFEAPDIVTVDVIIPVYRDLSLTRRCLQSVLADQDRPPGRVIVIDDHSPEPRLSAWLDLLANAGAITLLRNKKNLGFVASVNLGFAHAGDRDAALLNSDTEVPSGWLRRLLAQAYASPKIATVSPLSNNATICSYLGYAGGPMPPGVSLSGIDDACRAANAGRFVSAPTTVGFCMYIRRAALDDVGAFDARTFGKGYGEENDFCLRAAASGWRNHIACDTFVRHEGGASFGDKAGEHTSRAYAILTERYPGYASRIAEFVREAETEPFRFAATMSLFKTSGLPTILLLSHDLEGGVRRHVHATVDRHAGQANFLLLEPASRGVALSVPAMPDHPKLVLAAERWRDVALVARSAGVTRVHIHHLLGHDLDVRALIHELAVPFDVTVHDYFAICPQITLLPWSSGHYCDEPGPAGCDACIANRPSHGATDILSWRLRWTWIFHEADRVFTPSTDTLNRMRRYGVGRNARLAPHEKAEPAGWTLHSPPRPGKPLRIAVLGMLADHKGAQTVASVAMAADPAKLTIVAIGDVEASFPDAARERMTIGGAYREGDLPALLARYRPHVVWFPAAWPETFSFTLSAAIEAGLPIVASEIGAFPERLAARELTWLRPPTPDPNLWLAMFEVVAEALRARRSRKPAVWRCPPPTVKAIAASKRDGMAGPDPLARRGSGGRDQAGLGGWACHLLSDDVTARCGNVPANERIHPLHASAAGLIDLRRDDATAVVIVPETFDDGSYTPCAHIRLLRPFDHPAVKDGLVVTVADLDTATRYRADVILTQRHAVASLAAARMLKAHAERSRAKLIFDLDDDLLNIPPNHPEAESLKPLAPVVELMMRLADVVWTSTVGLRNRVAPFARDVRVVGNALDERIWLRGERPRVDAYGPVKILCMGSATHNADFEIILPALRDIHRRFGDQMSIDLIGFVSNMELPAWIRRLTPTPHASRSYPGFVHWITTAGPWDIGLAPLSDSEFNACKSPVKALDYAALGLAVLASDVPAYGGSLASGAGGRLVPNTTEGWYEALSVLMRDAPSRRVLASSGAESLRASGILASQAEAWRAAWPRTGTKKSRVAR